MKCSWSIAEGLETAKCAVVVHEGERALCCDIGAATKYKHSHMLHNLYQLESAKIIYSTGFFILTSWDSIMTAAKFAFDHKKIFAINLSAVYVCQFYTK